MAGGGSSDGDYGLQIAPMLDVMFVLLLFFMVMAGKQVKEAELGVQVPGASKAVSTAKTPVTIPVASLAAKALHIFETHRIEDLVVVDATRRPVGLVDAQDLTRFRLL